MTLPTKQVSLWSILRAMHENKQVILGIPDMPNLLFVTLHLLSDSNLVKFVSDQLKKQMKQIKKNP